MSNSQSINQLFATIARPPDAEIDAFVVFCIDRIERLFETEEARFAFQQLKCEGKVSPELAERVNVGGNSLSLRSFNAAKAIAHGVCHCAAPDSMYFSDQRVENARLVALYCQWAISRSEYPPDPDDTTDSDDGECDAQDDGRMWLMRQTESTEQAAQIAFIIEQFPHWCSLHKDDA